MKRRSPVLRSLIERFSERVDHNGPVPEHRPELGCCHIWTGALNGRRHHKYGRMKIVGVGVKAAHCVAFFLKHGVWPEPHGLHSCDNTACVNADHVFAGTQKDNMTDCSKKGRLLSQTRPESVPR